MLDTVIKAAAAALDVPLSPAPGRTLSPSAVYRFYPGRSDGALSAARLEIRVFHHSASAAWKQIESLCRALLADGDTGVVGTGGDALVICRSREGSRSGWVSGTNLCYEQAGFEIQGRM